MYISQIFLNRHSEKGKLEGSIKISGDFSETTIKFTTEEATELMASLSKVMKRQADELTQRFQEAVAAAPHPLLLTTETTPA